MYLKSNTPVKCTPESVCILNIVDVWLNHIVSIKLSISLKVLIIVFHLNL